jgi:AcrR family transcriptional regulator
MLQRKPRLDRDARREAILDVAEEVFVDQGFAAASMSEIAARVGGSKGTLYNYFKSKDELFEAYVQRHCQLNIEQVFDLPPEGEAVEATLRRVSRAYLRMVLSDENLRHFRLIVAEAQRAPEIGAAFYAAGPGFSAEQLARMISFWNQEGQLAAPDPETAAHHFVGLCQNRYFKQRLCNAIGELSEDQVEAQTDAAVKAFLALYGVRS